MIDGTVFAFVQPFFGYIDTLYMYMVFRVWEDLKWGLSHRPQGLQTMPKPDPLNNSSGQTAQSNSPLQYPLWGLTKSYTVTTLGSYKKLRYYHSGVEKDPKPYFGGSQSETEVSFFEDATVATYICAKLENTWVPKNVFLKNKKIQQIQKIVGSKKTPEW